MLVDGRRPVSLSYNDANAALSVARVALPAGVIGDHGDISIEWRIRDPRSPHSLGLSADRRALGLFVRRVALVERSGGPASR